MSFSSKLNIEILFQIVNKKCLHFDCDHRHERFHLKTHTSQSQVNVIHPLDSRPHVRDRTGTAVVSSGKGTGNTNQYTYNTRDRSS